MFTGKRRQDNILCYSSIERYARNILTDIARTSCTVQAIAVLVTIVFVTVVSRAYPPNFGHVPREYPRPTGQHEAVHPYAQLTVSLCPPTLEPLNLSITNNLPPLTSMSHTHPNTSSTSSSSNFQLMINNALDTYKKRTKNDLLAHPLATRLQTCNAPGAIVALLQEQVQGLDRSRSSDERWSKWLDPTVNVLQAFSSILEAGASLVCFRTY